MEKRNHGVCSASLSSRATSKEGASDPLHDVANSREVVRDLRSDYQASGCTKPLVIRLVQEEVYARDDPSKSGRYSREPVLIF
jgi:hypothetical protein